MWSFIRCDIRSEREQYFSLHVLKLPWMISCTLTITFNFTSYYRTYCSPLVASTKSLFSKGLWTWGKTSSFYVSWRPAWRHTGFRVGPKSSDWGGVPLRGVHAERQRKVPHEDWGRDQSDATTSQGMRSDARSWKRQGFVPGFLSGTMALPIPWFQIFRLSYSKETIFLLF